MIERLDSRLKLFVAIEARLNERVREFERNMNENGMNDSDYYSESD